MSFCRSAEPQIKQQRVDGQSRGEAGHLDFVESPDLARRLKEGLAAFIPENTYKVELADDGELRWRERVGNRDVHDTEPRTKWWQRAAVVVLSWLPIEWLL